MGECQRRFYRLCAQVMKPDHAFADFLFVPISCATDMIITCAVRVSSDGPCQISEENPVSAGLRLLAAGRRNRLPHQT